METRIIDMYKRFRAWQLGGANLIGIEPDGSELWVDVARLNRRLFLLGFQWNF